MERASGFYWVRLEDGWVIAQYDSEIKSWFRTGMDYYLIDEEFFEIDERRLERDNITHPFPGAVQSNAIDTIKPAKFFRNADETDDQFRERIKTSAGD